MKNNLLIGKGYGIHSEKNTGISLNFQSIEWYLLLLSLFISPFYLIFKYAILQNSPLWMLHGIIIIVLFILVFLGKIFRLSLKNYSIVFSKLDILI